MQAVAVVTLEPDAGSLPGSAQLGQVVNGLALWGLVAALTGVVIGAAVWALERHSSNYQQVHSGKQGVVVSTGAAALIGAVATLVNFLFGLGQAAN